MNRDETAQDEDNVTSDESTEEEVVSEDSAPEEAASDDTTEEEDSPSEEAAGSDYRSGRPFTSFALSEELLQGIQEHGYAEATPVQAQAIEPGLAGLDMIVRAKTGTGKTCAFSLPILERAEGGLHHPQAIVLAPTRELALQISEEMVALGQYKNIKILPVYGGVGLGHQEKALEEGVDIIVGTPGRVLDHIRRKNLDLSKCRMACLDEADEMLSMGFYEDVSKILSLIPEGGQYLLFSATVSDEVKRLVSRFLNDPVDLYLSTDTDQVEGITHRLYETDADFHRARALAALIDQENPGSTIIFCNTREDTSSVANYLDRQGFDVMLISGDLNQRKREQVIQSVKGGSVQFLVATDVASRGIDIRDITHVIHYGLPQDPAVYLHRAGRTGRIGKEGASLALASPSDTGTRKVLETRFNIKFESADLPSPEEAKRLRVERQIARIKAAAGSAAFESYLALVRDLKEREDGDLLLATVMRGFFLWEREQRTRLSKPEPKERSREDRPRRGRGEGRDRGGRRPRRDRGPKSDAPTSEKKSSAAPAESKEGGGAKRRRRRRRRRGSGSSSS